MSPWNLSAHLVPSPRKVGHLPIDSRLPPLQKAYNGHPVGLDQLNLELDLLPVG